MIWTPHLTVAAVIEQEGKFLMVEERDNGRTVFNQPAGHVENKETIHDAVIREVKEETAWDFLPEYIVGIYKWRKPDNDITFVRVCFAGIVSQRDPHQALDDGIIAATWLSHKELTTMDTQRMRSPLVRQCINDYSENTKYPLGMIKEW